MSPRAHNTKSNSLGPWAVVASLVAASLTSDATAQRFLVPHNSPRGLIALVDGNAGALVDSAWLDVQSTAIPPLTSGNVLRDVERVGDQIWVAGGAWVYRYDVHTRLLIDSFTVINPVRSLEASSGRVLITTHRGVLIRDPGGAALAAFDLPGASDTMSLFDGTMLVAIDSAARVDHYTSNGVLIGTFAGPTVPTAFGLLSRPSQLSRRRNGNILVCGDVRVYEFTACGTFVAEYDVGPFEGGVAETFSTRLLVPLGTGMAVYDGRSRTTVNVGGAFFGQGRKIGLLDRGNAGPYANGEAFTEVTCPASSAPSTGLAARLGVAGSAVAGDQTLHFFSDQLPPGAMTVLCLGRAPAQVATAGGVLCVDRTTLYVAPEPALATNRGMARFDVTGGLDRIITLFPGMTVHAQVLYRDQAVFRLSNGVRITLSQ